MIEFQFVGAAQTVTGSKHLIRTSKAQILLDCGLFQGHRQEADEKNRHLQLEPEKIDAIVLSHAHIDHSGALPSIYKAGYRGPIYTTPATKDLCAPMLLDTAWIMKSDAEHIHHMMSRGARHLKAFEPIYDESDVTGVLSLFKNVAYHHPQEIAPGITMNFLDAGHVLGSAITVLDIEDEGKHSRVVFTGDIGRKHLPILHNPETPEHVDYLIMESTYGDRLHDPIELTTDSLAEIIQRTYKRGGKVIIPSFALERAQELVFEIKKLYERKKVPHMPVYVDSPLTVKLTDVFKRHPECFDAETLQLLESKDSPFDFPSLKYISSVEESKRVSNSSVPCIVISASGMCEGGRVLHHLAASVENHRNTILIVGFQAENTLGRRFVEKRSEVKIYGTPYKLEAEVCVLNGFSGHADQNGLLNFVKSIQKNHPIKEIFLVHGDLSAQKAFSQKLNQSGFKHIRIPKPGEKFTF